MLKIEKSKNSITRLFGLFVLLWIAGCSGGSSNSEPAVGGLPSTTPVDGVPRVIARTGPIVLSNVGDVANLDGTKSTSSASDPLSFNWTLTSRPFGSNAEIQDVDTATPSLSVDQAGSYVAQLVVSSAGVTSQRAIELVVVSAVGVANAFHDGLSSDCQICHDTSVADAPSKSFDHAATSNVCATCHTPSPIGFETIHYVDHGEVFGNCSSCHNGTFAIGKSDFHITTESECDDCHDTVNFLTLATDGSFDHSTIVRECQGCHNGTVSIGKTPSPPHPDTQSDCGNCHSTESFASAYPDHTGPEVVGNRCDSCHGSIASGPIAGHPTPLVDCAECHGINTFSLDGVFNHRISPTVQPCESCHNGNNSINAPGKEAAVPTHIVTTDDCGSCHNTENFADAFVDHTGIVDNCVSCHDGTIARSFPINHMPTLEDCSVCHTPGTFATGIYDHTGVVDNCESCHDNVITLGKLIAHLPTTEDCSVCHNTLDFADATFDHVGIDTNNCASCHSGEISLGKSSQHVPTDLDCSSCHSITEFTTFAGIVYNHTGIDPTNCAACHATGISTPKIANHIPAEEECSTCHDSTLTFGSNLFLANVHSMIDRGCQGCHSDQFFELTRNLTKPSTHLPTTQDCSACHTTLDFAVSTFDHVGITNNCASCHDGSAAFVSLGALGKTDIPVHNNTNEDCSICHNTNDFAAAFVDHSSPEVLNRSCSSCHDGATATGKDAAVNHVTTVEDCGICHEAGGSFSPAVFNHAGITDNCASCHDGTQATGKDAKVNPPHIPTNDDCSVCHVPTVFANAHFDHQNIANNCSSCHNGITATGKGPFHVPTSQDCVACHQTTGFVPGSFDHVGIVDNCSSCHDAGFATPKSTIHLTTNQDCVVCHTTNAFVPANFDHTGIVDGCSSCHDGVTAVGMDIDHLDTALDCHFCHTTATFVGGNWVHDETTVGRCDDCHSQGGGAAFKPQNHLATTSQCDQCHVTTGWAPTSFTHSPNSDYPGDHRRDPGCTGCHGGTISATIPYPSPQYAPFCAGCHERDFEREDDHIGGKNGTVQQNRDCSGGGRGCHRVTNREF